MKTLLNCVKAVDDIVLSATQPESNDDLASFFLHLIGRLEDILYRWFACHRCGVCFPVAPLLAQHEKMCSLITSENYFQCFKTSHVVDKLGTPVTYTWGCDIVTFTQHQYEHHIQGHDGSQCAVNRAIIVYGLKMLAMNHVSQLVPQAPSITREDFGSYVKALRRQVYFMDRETSGAEKQLCWGCDQVILTASGGDTGQTTRVDGGDARFLINALGVSELFEEVGG
jgi:hypothetical protein